MAKKIIKYFQNNTEYILYIVKKGDSLYQIAKKYNIPIVSCISDDYYFDNEAVALEVEALEKSNADACYADTMGINAKETSKKFSKETVKSDDMGKHKNTPNYRHSPAKNQKKTKR